MSKILNTNKFLVPTQVLARQVAEETVILDMESGTYYGLDTVGARVWQLMTEDLSFSEIIDILLTEFDVERHEVERDVESLAAILVGKRLLIVQ